MSTQKFTTHKAWSGGGGGFLAMLMAPIGVEPDTTYTIVVLLSALFSPWTGAAIDPELFQQAVKGLWMAVFAGAGVHQAVYWTPNKLKDLLPVAERLLEGISTTTPEPAKPGSTSAGGTIASIAPTLCVGLVAAMLLSGCVGGDAADKALEQAVPDTAQQPKSPTQEIADKLFGEAIGEEAREVRQCMIASGIIELLTWRVTDGGDSAYAATAAGQIKRIKAALASVDPSTENDFFETDMKHVTIELASILVKSTEDRIESLVKKFAGGPNAEGILERVGVAGGQIILTDGIVRDVKKAVTRISDGKRTPAAVMEGCDKRIARNERRIDAILGVVPADPSS